jgi:regulator of sigma E protease
MRIKSPGAMLNSGSRDAPDLQLRTQARKGFSMKRFLAYAFAFPLAIALGAFTGKGVIFAILGLGMLIFLHESGHFLAAKYMKMPVEVFSIGFGPRLFGFKWRETDVRLSALPLGGYVKLAGFNPEDPGADDPHGFLQQPYWKRMLFYSGGIIANLITAFTLFVFVGADQARVTKTTESMLVGRVEANTPAEQGGLRVGDELKAIGPHRFPLGVQAGAMDEFFTKEAQPFIQMNAGKPIPVELLRDGKPLTLTLTPAAVEGKGRLGFSPISIGTPTERRSFQMDDFRKGFGYAGKTSLRIGGVISDFLKRLVSFQAKSGEVGGPVAIVKQMAQASSNGIWDFFFFCGAISLQLAILNALPVPMLDGGHMIVLTLEKIRRRDFTLEFKEKLFTGGAILLMSLMAIVIFLDFWKMRH